MSELETDRLIGGGDCIELDFQEHTPCELIDLGIQLHLPEIPFPNTVIEV